jgi:hypothetical protein
MGVATNYRLDRLPKHLPAGAVYVIEGRGAEFDRLRVSARYVMLPNGRRIEFPADLPRGASAASARSLVRRRTRGQTHKQSRPALRPKKLAAAKKNAAQRGTIHQGRR